MYARTGTHQMAATPDPVGPGQESVWAYPRPAIAEPCARHVSILHKGHVVADTRASIRTLETSHPPSYYCPPADIDMTLLTLTARTSLCEWKGHARYYDVRIGTEVFRDVAWSYPNPTRAFAILRDHIAFYAAPFERCYIDGERVVPQAGGFYGGWITPHVAGPFKGRPGSMFW
jgi:uncharacterized protein (DUF427 family)